MMHNRTKTSQSVRWWRRRGLNLLETLILCGMLALATAGALWFRHGVFGVWGVIVGGLAGCMTLPAVMCLFAVVWILFIDGYPWLPACRNGCCVGTKAYELQRFGDGFAWNCKCGDHYERRGRDLVYLDEQGTATIIRTWRPFRGWFPRVRP